MSFVGMPITTAAFPSIGSLLGSTGHQAMIDSINQSLGSKDFFGSVRDRYADIRHVFLDNIIAPIKATAVRLGKVVTQMLKPDTIRSLVSQEDFNNVPPSMHLPILFFEPVQKLLQQGRIQGFGYDPKLFEGQEDVSGRLINNGRVDGIADAEVDEEGGIPLVYVWDSFDPDLSEEELEAIDETRDAIMTLLNTTKLDPTDISSERG